uniref:Uncharacterized protein n=1 Tax=Fundulus heteroclitus TaxID=8078 RepID=A0A3Q2QUC3_FUNHE
MKCHTSWINYKSTEISKAFYCFIIRESEKNAWNEEPLGFGPCGVVLPFSSRSTKYTAMMDSVGPYDHPEQAWLM